MKPFKVIGIIDLFYWICLGNILRAPAGGHEPDTDLIYPALRVPGIFGQQPQVLIIDSNGVPGTCRSGDAVHRRNMGQFFLESAEEFVPDNKDLGKVFIQVLQVDRVMYPVM